MRPRLTLNDCADRNVSISSRNFLSCW